MKGIQRVQIVNPAYKEKASGSEIVAIVLAIVGLVISFMGIGAIGEGSYFLGFITLLIGLGLAILGIFWIRYNYRNARKRIARIRGDE
jgi:hypothetical protein